MNEAPRNDYRVIIGLCGLTSAAVLPFFVYHVFQAAWFMATITGVLVLFTGTAVVWLYLRRGQPRLIHRAGTVIVFLANLSVSLSIANEQQNTIYWVYPLIFINFYLLGVRTAAALNLVVCGLALWLVAGAVPGEQLARLAGSIPLCIFFGLVFSLSVIRQRRDLQHLASHDALTGIGNRLSLDSTLDVAGERLRRYGETSTLILLDLDHFKAINDSLGHLKGDELIVEFARLLKSRIRKTDQLFRFGGEEFVVLLPHTSLPEAFHLAEALRVAVEHHRFVHDRTLSVSGGISELGRGETPDSWLDRADRALYRAKEQGRNRIIAAEQPTAGP